MDRISFFREKVKQSQCRITELKQSFLAFIAMDEDFIFSVESESRGLLQPYMDEINELKKYNLAVTRAIQGANEIYNQLRQEGLVFAENPEESINIIENTIHSYRSRSRGAQEKLERLKIIDQKTQDTVISAEHKKQAGEMKSIIIVEIPGKIKALEDAKLKIEKLFDGLDISIPAPGQNLPKPESQMKYPG